MRIELPRVLTPAVAVHHGVSRSRVRTEVRNGRWQPLAPGLVLTRSGVPGRLDWADAGLALAGPSGALSGWDACRLLGAGDRQAPAAPVLVLTREARSRRVAEVLVRRTDRPFSRLDTPAASELPFAPVVALERAVADAALTLGRLDSVRALVASAVRSGRCQLDDIARELAAGPQQHSALLRTVLGEIALGARSAAEARALSVLLRCSVPTFELNVPVLDATGRTRWVLDVLWRELRAVLEIDSVEFHFGVREWQATMARHNSLQQRGLAVAHYPPSRIMRDPDGWGREVEGWLRSRARELGVPYRVGGAVPGRPFAA